MSDRTVDRHTFHPTRHRGFTFRVTANGDKAFYGYVPGKGRVKLRGGTYQVALTEWNEICGKARKGERVVLPSKKKVAEVGEEYLRDAESGLKRGEEHRRQFEREILPEWGHRAISSITPQDVIRLDKKLRDKGLAEATVGNYLKPARGMFEFAVLEEYISVSPFALVPRGRLSSCNKTREHREWTTAEVLLLIEKGYELDARPKARAEYGLGVEMKVRTGARLGELLGGRHSNIDFEQGVWTISSQWTKDGEYVDYVKTEKSLRRVPLAPALLQKIAARKLRLGAGDDDFVHASHRGGNPPSHTNFRRRAWTPAVEAAGLTDGPKVTPHDARHAFASEMAEQGLSSADVGEVLGHTTAGITEKIYTHVFNREEREQRVREAMAEAMGR